MKTIEIRLTTLEDVRNFVNIVTRYDIDVDLSSGRYVVDAKSIMGIFSLDLLSPIKLTAYSENPDKLFDELKPYII
ncbi:MAG: HPr family phosphocarrier protein [Clostridia bacterium]|nr:HPr family phosphocarrier protein [Clostridia bacterium]